MANGVASPNSSSLWVFGYGSLCWHPGFEYGDKAVGHIRHFARKFWQGNTEHRGTAERPGRVATLVEEQNAYTHGVAFQLLGEQALEYLEKRECTLGGYKTLMTTFQPEDRTRDPFPVLLYIATESNQHWMGPAPAEAIAEQVVNCSGPAGHNVEYVLKLAEWLRDCMPKVTDSHLYDIEISLRRKIAERNLPLECLMGKCSLTSECPKVKVSAEVNLVTSDEESDDDSSSGGFSFATGVGRKGLRCVKM